MIRFADGSYRLSLFRLEGVDFMEEKMQKPVLAGALVAIALVAAIVGYRFVPQGEVRPNASAFETPEFKFMLEKARACQGDFNKLSPADQQAVLAKQNNNRNYAQMAMKSIYEANK
jgi:hypothetical protein